MKLKRVTAMVSAVVMVFSLLAGVSGSTQSAAKTNSELPKTAGLYRAEWICRAYDEKTDSEFVRTDKDANGNEVLVDDVGNFIRYQDQDNPEYLTNGIKDGWGLGCSPVDDLWFDYVSGNKVKHANLSDLKFTNLDGTALTGVDFESARVDPRAISVNAKKTGPILVTYKGAKKNNKMIIDISLSESFYTANPASIESYVNGDLTVVSGKTKDVYLDLITNWEEARYKIDPATMISVEYWDDAKREDVVLTGADAASLVTVTPVSTDEHHPVYKLTVNGKIPAENSDSFRIRCRYKKYDVNAGDESGWDEDRDVNFRVVEGNTLTGLDTNWNLYIDGNGELNVKEDEAHGFQRENYYDGVPGMPIFIAFRYIDADGNASYVTDAADLTFYDTRWDDAAQKHVLGDKVPAGTVTVEPAGKKTPVVSLNFLPDDLERDGDHEFIVAHKDQVPDPDKALYVNFTYHGYGDGFYKSKKASADTWFNSTMTDGNEDIKIYLAICGNEGRVKAAKFKAVHLIDAKGHDDGGLVKVKSKAGVKFANERSTIESLEITIPAGVIYTDYKLNVEMEVDTDYGGKETWGHFNNYIFYHAAGKGTKYTLGGVTYKVTGEYKAVVSKVKASAKKVVIPRFAGVMKVTAIEKNAMKGCKKLTKIDVESEYIKSVGKGAFDGVPAKAVAKVPKSKKKAYSKMFKTAGFKGKVK